MKQYYISSGEHIDLEIPIKIEIQEGFYFNGRYILPTKVPPVDQIKSISKDRQHIIKYDIIETFYCVCRSTDKIWVPRYDDLNYRGIEECDNHLKNLILPISVHVLILKDKNKKIEHWDDFYHLAWASIYDNYEDAEQHTFG